MTTPRIYVGTYAKYNAGNLKGQWFDLEDYPCKQDFEEACLEFHEDEADPELMFQDFEDIPKIFITKCRIDDEFWIYMDFEDHYDGEAKAAFCECFDRWSEGEFQNAFRGHYNSWEDMAEEYMEETMEIPEHLMNYIDYEKFANDLCISGDLVEHNNYFFWNY